MPERRPSVFIGSSTVGLPIAEAIQQNLDYHCDVVWCGLQGVFGLSGRHARNVGRNRANV